MHRRRPAEAAVDAATGFALAAREGDEAALVAMIESTQADVWRFCAHLASSADADDLTQETFVRAVLGLPRFRGQSSIRTWLLSIARRVVADDVRAGMRRTRLARALDDVAATDPLASGGRPDPGDAVTMDDLIDGLREDRRTAFVLTQVLGYAYAEAAEICRCPVGTIRSRVARARADLIGGLHVDLASTPSASQAPDRRTDADHDKPPAH